MTHEPAVTTFAAVVVQPRSNWERGAGSSRTRRMIVIGIVAIVVVAVVAGVIVGLSSTQFRLLRELSDGSPQIVASTYYQVTPRERLTITTKPAVTRAEALAFKCETVLPLLVRENLSPEIEIRHPGNDFVVVDDPCP